VLAPPFIPCDTERNVDVQRGRILNCETIATLPPLLTPIPLSQSPFSLAGAPLLPIVTESVDGGVLRQLSLIAEAL